MPSKDYYMNMLYSIVLHIIGGTLSLWIATTYVEGVSFTGSLQTLFIAGSVLGALNAVLKPILNLLTLPLKILTLGLFSLVIQAALIWTLDILFPELSITGLIPLFQTTVIVWIVTSFISVIKK